MRTLIIVLALAACGETPPMEKYVRALDDALQANPQTPNAVGEAGTNLVIYWDGSQK